VSALHRVVGIDLGTTYSAVAAYNADTMDVELISDGSVAQGGAATPSVVWDEPGVSAVVVGHAAKRAVATDPGNTIIEIKREMGATVADRPGADESIGSADARDDEPVRVWFRGRWRLPQEISALVLMRMKEIAEAGVGGPVHDAVITVPAYFTERQKRATKEAALLAGLYPRQLIPEPTAAAICYGSDRADSGRHVYLIYDLGGGTFDVSIIVIEQENIEVVATSGNARLGGGNVDDRIAGWAMERVGAAPGSDAIWEAKLKAAAELAKRELAVHDRTLLRLPSRDGALPAEPLTLELATFESLIADLLRTSLDCVEDALQQAAGKGIDRSDVDAVLLVGGSTRIKKVRRMLLEYFGKADDFVREDGDPDTLVARGAAILANRFEASADFDLARQPDRRQLNIDGDDVPDVTYITEHTLGVGIEGGLVDPLILRGENPPRSKTETYTNPDEVTQVHCPVYQGESRYSNDNSLIGTVLLDTIESRPQGYHKFEVTYSLDVNGLLDVRVKHCNVDKEYQGTFEQSTEIGRISRLAELREELLGLYRGAPCQTDGRSSAEAAPLPDALPDEGANDDAADATD
jgi:molecular chaperone DnaK (HSP70)